MSESSETGRTAETKNISELGEYNLRSSLEGSTSRPEDKGAAFHSSKSVTKSNDFRLGMHPPETPSTEAYFSIHLDDPTSHEAKEINVTAAANPSSSSMEDLSNNELTCTSNVQDLSKALVNSTIIESEEVQNHDKAVTDDLNALTSELEHLEQELDLTTVAAEMVLSDQHSSDFYLDQLNEQLHSKRNSLFKLYSEWDAVRKPLEEKRKGLQESLFSNIPEAQEMLRKLREVEQEEQYILSEIKKRDEEYSKLSADLEEQPKLASRKSYIERIKEITKNSRKQDADIERILKETREVQLESNSIQERLHRTYAVADEIIFREAKKAPMGRQVYRLLTSIHQSFEQMSEKILATDRIQREVAEYEMKLAAMASRNLDVEEKKC